MTESSYYQARNSALITGLSLKARKQVYERFFARFGESQRILDVGVTSEKASPEANFLEKLFPHKERITAVGIEDASFLETEYPGLKYVRIESNQSLPFPDQSFDVVFSHAVVEHVVDAGQRKFFIDELLRVGRSVFITTPDKYFPIETHTRIPLLHFVWPRLFYWLCDRKIASDFYSSQNLRLLSRAELGALVDPDLARFAEIEQVRSLGFSSNLILTITRPR
jgi:2-polyprenyl-3-methyl-5-hydroxy-6-metoxy-1,4-benzoquinol methylase